MPTVVAGVDTSTQSCKVVVRDADSGELLRSGSARHPGGTSVDPQAWWRAFTEAADEAGGLDDVAALAVGGQQHGMVCLDESGEVVRDALLWNDTRSAGAARDLIDELPGGADGWAEAVGLVPVASFTVTKLRWLARAEPDNAARTAAVCLPHDWLTWRLRGYRRSWTDLVTDRGDASGTGYWSPSTGKYREDLLELAFGARPLLPTVLGPADAAGRTPAGAVLGPGTGDNAAAALGVQARAGDVVVSIGTSGVVSAVSPHPSADPSGIVAGFADATGQYLPLVCTLNAALVLDSTARLLGVSLQELSDLALSAPAGAGGLALVPYFDGERTPNRPDATGSLLGLRHETGDAGTHRPGPRSRACSAGWPTGWTRCASRASTCSACCWSAAARSPRRCGASRRPCSPRRWRCRSRASTSRTAPRGRPPGCCPALRRRRSGSRASSCATRPTRCRRYASAMPRCAS